GLGRGVHDDPIGFAVRTGNESVQAHRYAVANPPGRIPRLLNLALSGFPRHVHVSNAAFAQESPDDRESAPVSPQRRTTPTSHSPRGRPPAVAAGRSPGTTISRLVIEPFPCASPAVPSRPSAPPSAARRSGSASGGAATYTPVLKASTT